MRTISMSQSIYVPSIILFFWGWFYVLSYSFNMNEAKWFCVGWTFLKTSSGLTKGVVAPNWKLGIETPWFRCYIWRLSFLLSNYGNDSPTWNKTYLNFAIAMMVVNSHNLVQQDSNNCKQRMYYLELNLIEEPMNQIYFLLVLLIACRNFLYKRIKILKLYIQQIGHYMRQYKSEIATCSIKA